MRPVSEAARKVLNRAANFDDALSAPHGYSGLNVRMNGWIWRPVGLLALTALACGCQREANIQWAPSARVVTLDKKLQHEIGELLIKHTGTAARPKLLGNNTMDTAQLKRGQAIYERRCSQCHGVSGDGAGPASANLRPLPRDYRPGVFKFTSTPYGSKPRRSDLMRTLRRGVPGTAMPSFALLSNQELEDVLDYVLVLTHRGELEQRLADDAEAGEIDPSAVPDHINNIVERWHEAEKEQVTPLSPMPDYTTASIATGRQAFLDMQCNKCHGNDGRGGSLGNVEVGKDVWGHTTAAADLTSGMFRGGGRPIDIYRRIYSGINGTPMPGFSSTLEKEPEKIWHLVHFIKSVGNQRRESLPTLESMWKRTAVPKSSTGQPPPANAQPTGAADGH